MYLDYFGLKETPFSIAPDPRYLYMSERHREALAHLLYGVTGQGGFIVLTGEVGTGKTTICRCFLNQIPNNTDVAFIINPKLSARELMASICDELSIAYPDSASIKVLNDLINAYLLNAHANNRHTVLIIDEAQNLRIDVLEQLRLLTNLETSEKKLLQIILLGQPELRDVLAKNELRQLAQRVTARYHLNELNQIEVGAYVNCRLAVAGRKGRLFEQKAIKKLYKLSNGVPRLINLISDRALLGAYASQADMVEEQHVKSAYDEIIGEQPKSNIFSKIPGRVVNTILVLALIFTGGGWIASSINSDNYTSSSTSPSASSSKSSSSNSISNSFESGSGEVSSENEISRPRTANKELNNRPVYEQEAASGGDVAKSSFAVDSVQSPEPVVNRSDHSRDTGVIPESQKNGLSAPVLESLNELPVHKDDKFYAYQATFERWGVKYRSAPFMLACDFGEMYGLRCLHKTGNWRSVLKLNRPAVMSLINESGEKVYLALLAVDGQDALVSHNRKKYWVSLDEIDRYWLGEYSIVWKLPPYKSNFVIPGQLEEDEWLHSALNRVGGYGGSGLDVQQRVRRFQKDTGLQSDGIAGSMTLIQLNSTIDSEVPRLIGGG